MNEKSRLIKNTGIIAIGNLSTKLVSFLLLPLYTSILSTSEYGTVDYIISLSVFFAPVISLLMDESMFRFLIDCKNDKEKTQVISISLIYILIGSIIFLFIALPVKYLFNFSYANYLIVYVLSIVLSSMISALLRGIGRTDKYAVYNFLISVSQLVLNVVFIALLSYGVDGMLLASIISHAVFPIIYVYNMKLWRYISFKNIEKKLAVDMIKYSIPLIPNKLSWTIINLSDRIIIMNVLGSNQAGLYAISNKFPSLMDMIYGFFYQSWKESSARIVNEKSKDQFYNEIYNYLKKIMFSIVLCIISFMPIAFKIMINSSFYDAIWYVPILLLGTYYANISGFYGGIFTAYKDTKIMGVTTIVAALLNLVINILLIWKVGLYAAAISTFVSNFVVYLYRKNKVSSYVKLFENRRENFIAYFILFIVISLFYLNTTISIVVSCLISIFYGILNNLQLLKSFSKLILAKGK